jgi:hypothetical protein
LAGIHAGTLTLGNDRCQLIGFMAARRHHGSDEQTFGEE